MQPEEKFMVYPPENHYDKFDENEVIKTLMRYGYKAKSYNHTSHSVRIVPFKGNTMSMMG